MRFQKIFYPCPFYCLFFYLEYTELRNTSPNKEKVCVFFMKYDSEGKFIRYLYECRSGESNDLLFEQISLWTLKTHH